MKCTDCKKDETCGSRKGSHANCFEPKKDVGIQDIVELETLLKSGGLLQIHSSYKETT
jgi:hypothetical protein